MHEESHNYRIKCYKCMRPNSTCICKHIRSFKTKTRFVILMHPKEYKKEKNGTGIMTKLQLNNAEIVVGVDFTNNKRINNIIANKENSSFLLYPGKESFNLSTRKKTETESLLLKNPHIFILDGTWPCARKMLKLSKNLHKLNRISFDNKIKSKFIIKQQPESLCLSTIESVFTVLNLLKKAEIEDCDTSNFLVPFEKMIAHQLDYLLNPKSKNYLPEASKIITPKNSYKKETQRSIIYEQE
ncbi:tRNA-uridine aminocarboxypropyltransferase [uncultured Polaribacter sp.]|uniref:tRNA-uridine aminocarboxypropyltransferase n=1 Tax=uncultured Polaribacter sp. TaxID=174711 RepID=UPI00262DED39|nr:tRNA-uridine aminocarboxypropyltransferase [uncultured Polaribacter sp.]